MNSQLEADYKKAAVTLTKLLGGDTAEIVGSGPHNVDRMTEVALVGLLVAELRLGGRSPNADEIAYEPRPSHFPSDDDELRSIYMSTAKGDQSIRQDVIEWRDKNRTQAQRQAAWMRAPIEAYRKAMLLLETSTSDSEAQEQDLGKWAREIAQHLGSAWRVNPEQCDAADRDLFDWCLARVAKNDPTPKSVRTAKRYVPRDQRADQPPFTMDDGGDE